MRKKTASLAALLLILFTTGCALSDSIRARTLLQNCSFALERVDLSILNIAPFIRFDGKSEKISVENPPVKELLGMIPQIKRGEFSLDFSKLTFSPRIAVDNPNNQEVTLDSMSYEVFIDETFLMNADHQKRVTIPANKTDFVTVTLTLPTDIPLAELIEAQKIRLKGTAFLKLNITPKKSVTLNIPIDMTRDIPREQLYAKLEEEKNRVVKELLKNVKNKGAKSVLDAIF